MGRTLSIFKKLPSVMVPFCISPKPLVISGHHEIGYDAISVALYGLEGVFYGLP